MTLAVWLPMLGWYAALRPGMMTTDSLNIWRQVTEGDWVDLHPPAYTAAVWLSSVFAGGPDLATLGQSLFLAASIVAVARSVLRLGAPRPAVGAVVGVLAVSPMLGGFAVSIWKDVPYTAAVLFVAARVLDLTAMRLAGEQAGVRPALRAVAGWLMVATVFRQNGVVFSVVVLGVLFLVFRAHRRTVALSATAVVLMLVVLKAAVYPAAGVSPAKTPQSLALFLHDVAAVARTDPAVFDAQDRALLAAAAPFAEWRALSEPFGCSSTNWQWLEDFDWEQLRGRTGAYLDLWRRIAAERPGRVLANRLCVGAIAWRPDTVGLVYTVSRGVDPNDLGLRTRPIVGGLDEPAAALLDLTDRPGVQWLLWRGAVWTYASWIAVAVAAWRLRRRAVLLAALPGLALQLSVFPVNPSQDARYMFAGLLVGVLLLPLAAAARSRVPAARPEAVVPRPAAAAVPVVSGTAD